MLKRLGLLLVIAALIPVMLSQAGESGPVSLFFLDVGQGDALLIHQPGSCAALVDSGGLVNGHRVTARLHELQIDKLDMVIITHPHLDHFGGLFDIAPRITIGKLYDNGARNKVWEYFDDYDELRKQLDHAVLQRGDRLKCGDIDLQILYPDQQQSSPDDLNSGSLAMLISYADSLIMHMGDLAGPGVLRFVELFDIPEADILKVAHHGASDAAPTELIDRVKPQYAVISTASTNRIGSPAQTTLDRLAVAGITLLRTDLDGSLHFTLDHSGYRLQPPR